MPNPTTKYGARLWADLKLDICHRFRNWIVPVVSWAITTIVGFSVLAYRKDGDWMSDWTNDVLIAAPVAGVTVVVCNILYSWAFAPRRIYYEDQTTIATMKSRFDFTAPLKAKREEISAITFDVNNQASLDKAHRQLADVQVRIIKTLRRDDSEWRHAPVGWTDDNVKLIFAWAGLAEVFSQRYPDEISSPIQLYDAGDHMVREIRPENFQAVKAHAINLTNLIIREIESPELVKATETPEVFAQFLNRYPWRNHEGYE